MADYANHKNHEESMNEMPSSVNTDGDLYAENPPQPKPPKKGPPKIGKREGLQAYLVARIEESGYWAFRAENSDDKVRTILSISANNVCRIVSADYVAAKLADYLRDIKAGGKEITAEDCARAVRRWAWVTERRRIEVWPASAGFKSGTDTVFTRLPFDPEPFEGPLGDVCPVLANTLSRMTNAKAFCHRVAAIFDKHASRKQAVWIWGPTDGGKSFIQDLLSWVVGGPNWVADLGEEDLRGAHWKYALVAKALIMLREAPLEFVRSLVFKMLTGDGYHLINPKGLPQFKAKLGSLLFCCSNQELKIPDDQALRNRLVICKLDPVPKGDQIPEHKLMDMAKEELPKFLWYCMQIYEASGSKKAENDQDGEAALDAAVEAFEEPLQDFFDLYFRHAKGAETQVTSAEFARIVRCYGNKEITIDAMRDFVRSRYGSSVGKLVRQGGGVSRFVTEIALRSMN